MAFGSSGSVTGAAAPMGVKVIVVSPIWTYEFVGKVQINNGIYQSVQVILQYPDSQEYSYDVGGMGGSNQTIKEFSLFPADRYKGTNPEKIIALDGKRYATAYKYENGLIAWVATPDNPLNR